MIEGSEPRVTVPAQHTGTFVELSGCGRPHDDALTLFEVRIESPGLSAASDIESIGGDGLDAFARGMHEDFRGWTGERVWTSFQGDLELRASHTGRVIWLTWTLRFPCRAATDRATWTASVQVSLAPGEELRVFASDIAEFFAS